MIDQNTIYTTGDRVQIKPELLTQDDCLLDGWLPCQRRSRDKYAKHAPGEETLRFHSHFEIFADRALVVHARSRAGMRPDQNAQYVSKIEINPRKILYGQNGIPITNDKDLCAALLIARHALAHLLVTPWQASELIPGLRQHGHSYWRKLEIALDIHDPGYAVRRQMRYMQSPYIRVATVLHEDSVHLKGTHLELKSYDKVKERERRFGKKNNSTMPSADEITRLEVVLPQGIIPKGFPLQSKTIRLMKFVAEQRLTGFTWNDLRDIHRTYFKGIKGVYYIRADKESGYRSGIAAAMAVLARDHNIGTAEIRSALEHYGGKSKDSSRRMEKQILDFLEQASELDADSILSDKAYENPPLIGVSALDGCRFYVEHYGRDSIYHNADEVFAVYAEPQKPAHFVPIVNDHKYWLRSAFTS